MRAIVESLIYLYLLPIRLSQRLALYAKGKIFGPEEHFMVTLDVIRRWFPNDHGTVIDVGAFDADSTILLAKNLTKNKIIGFEPNPIPYTRAKENAKSFTNVEIINLGFSDQTGEFDFYLANDNVSSSLNSIKKNGEMSFKEIIKVKVDTLDNFFLMETEILLLKLDVQGAEAKILRAGNRTLERTKLVLTEVLNTDFYEGGCWYFEVDEILRKSNFRIHSIITNYNFEGVKYFDILYFNTKYQKYLS